ncbi:MAG: ABC transporter substrate-binding protein, partial [Gammaproteobacteria bacterium]|nr:ABC transporter substrate-binding protein [Gammaproteobacteria bacterium]
LALFGLMQFAYAGSPPDQVIRDTTDKLIDELDADRQALSQDNAKLYKLVDDIVVPHFDFTRMSRLVLGRSWKNANKQQQTRFVEEFRTLLVRTYATALFEYNTENSLAVKPLKIKDQDKRVVVRTEFDLGNGPPVTMNYSFHKNKAGDWKVYDVSVDGVSLVTNYRSSYNRIIQSKGMDALIESLTNKNVQLSSS